jgi:primosomal protein N' (replication factor Y)
MLFAKVVLGLPIEGPFDYSVPEGLKEKIQPGIRCHVPFRSRNMLGYVVGVSGSSAVKGIRPLLDVIDEIPVMDDDMLTLTREVARYYFCSWGEAIEAALPKGLRNLKPIGLVPLPPHGKKRGIDSKVRAVLIHDLDGSRRWEIYLRKISECIKAEKAVIFLTPQIESAKEVQSRLKSEFDRDIALLHSRQSAADSLAQWQKIRNSQAGIVVGTRLAVFSPVRNPGLIIVDNETDQSYKQDQTPHYHAREVAFMRARISSAELLLSDTAPSLEMLYAAKKKKMEYIFMGADRPVETKIIDLAGQGFVRGRKSLFSFALQNALTRALEQKQKIIIFINQKGFATSAICPNCRKFIRCPRCNVNLVYHFQGNRMVCHYCNYETEAPQICPDCHAGYIRYSGAGTEKIESELSRLYPQARILAVDKQNKSFTGDYDILISTSFIFRHRPQSQRIDLIAALSIDNSLNRTDFRAAEKTFSLLMQLVNLKPKELIIQTFIPRHYCFQAVKNSDPDFFYKQELAFRKQLKFPPFSHMAVIKIRGAKAERVREQGERLFDKMKETGGAKSVNVISFTPGQPAKLRGNFYWQILMKSKSVDKIGRSLKKHLKGFSSSGIIVTVDVDPI